jgi:site-specific DNA-cytosine methylase
MNQLSDADMIPDPPAKLELSNATNEERVAFQAQNGSSNQWPPILPLEMRDDHGKVPRMVRGKFKRNALEKIMSTDQTSSRQQASKRVDGQGLGERERSTRYWLDESLPVLFRPEDIFADMVRRFPEVSNLASSLRRPLKVATMCSGTEAPLLALDLVSRACEAQKGVPFLVSHVFSSEVEPFKQAYIERNFSPPLLFRDVRELGGSHAHTAFGSLEEVPRKRGDVDILVAGTSCVDYSNLNTSKKTLEQLGESGQTFYGMFKWVQRARPPLVLLENVCGAPWKGMIRNFETINYHAQATRLDTKNYYLPQTRTRGYMLAIADEVALPDVIYRWEKQLRALERDASASLEAFMLDAHDPRVLAAREDLSYKRKDKEDTPWDKCEARHARVRIEEKIGQKRPLTNWVHGVNVASLPDFAWRDWAGAQTERVLDSIDIDYIRLVKQHEDANFKTSVWDLSQNVDRSNPTRAKLGICPCLTPSLCAYVTNQGRPVVGIETLALQGIPIDDLLLTRETEENLTSLSGNAMSTTVVGSAIIAALLVLPTASLDRMNLLTYPDHTAANIKSQSLSPGMQTTKKSASVSGSQDLVRAPLDLGVIPAPFLQGRGTLAERMLYAAARSAKRCGCESNYANAHAKILRCTACGHCACEKCAGKPEHASYERDDRMRVCARKFESALGLALPMTVVLSGVPVASLLAMQPETIADLTCTQANKKRKLSDSTPMTASDDPFWNGWVKSVARLEGSTFRLIETKRSVECWKARYIDASGDLRLELTLGNIGGLIWRAFIEPPREQGLLRDRLNGSAVLCGSVDQNSDDIIAADWNVCLPIDDSSEIELSYDGPLVEAFVSSFGIEDESIADRQRHSYVNVKVLKGISPLDENVSGRYALLSKCAAPLGSLHKRVSEGPELYLFLESKPVGPASSDTYVFARDWRRLALREARPSLVCSLPRGWRPPEHLPRGDALPPLEVKNVTSCGRWVPIAVRLSSAAVGASIALLKSGISVDLSCPWNATAILEVTVDLRDICTASDSPIWGGVVNVASDQWTSLTLGSVGARGVVGSAVGKALGFLVPRLKLPLAVSDWLTVLGGSTLASKVRAGLPCCAVCAPLAPTLTWVKVAGKANQFTAIEDPYLAGEYERALKNRPPAFELDAKRNRQNGTDIGSLRVAVNPMAITVRAFSALPLPLQARADTEGEVRLHFRIVEGCDDDNGENYSSTLPVRAFYLSSNRTDIEASQTPGFLETGSALRPEQLRSLTWMQRMEMSCEPFIEEEVIDEALSVLNWRAEARVQVPVMVRGGVLADAVGYGKTAITLALIDAEWRNQAPKLPPHLQGKAIPCKATLVIVPKHLMAQWPNELNKFLGNRYKSLAIMNVGDLVRLTLNKVLDAEIIFMSVQVFRSKAYFEHLANFASVHAFPTKGGRYFEEVHGRAIRNIEKYVSVLQTSGPVGLNAAQKADKKALRVTLAVNTSKKQAYEAGVPLRGQREARSVPAVKPPFHKPQRDTIISSFEGECELTRNVTTKVQSNAVVQWRNLKSPPLELFYFARKVVDEYTYLDQRDVPTVQAIKSRCSWVLSGTPPLESFDDVKSIAAYLNVHLGAPNPVTLTKKGDRPSDARKELSKSELFQEFLETKSHSWHARRRLVAQHFLDRFVRQNVAEIDEIPFEAEIKSVIMPAPERAVYLELEHHLYALEMQKGKAAGRGNKKRGRGKSDREIRLSEALEGATDAEEALLKKCARAVSKTPGTTYARNAITCANAACSAVVAKRTAELEDCATQIVREVAAAHRVEEEIRRWALTSISRPITGDRGCDDIFKKHGSSMWQVDGETSVRGKTKQKYKPGKAFDTRTGHQHMREWRNELTQGVGDFDASAQLTSFAAEALEIARGDLTNKASAERLFILNVKGLEEQSDFNMNSGSSLGIPEQKFPMTDERPRPEILKTTSCADLVFPEPIVKGESASARKLRDDTLKELFWALRNQVYELRALNKEFVGRTRSLRFFKEVEKAQLELAKSKIQFAPPSTTCHATSPASSLSRAPLSGVPLSQRAIFSCCGHVGEISKMRIAASREECPVTGCCANVRSHSLVECMSLCASENNSDAHTVARHGAKLAKIIDLIRSIPHDERILIFVQFEDLLAQVHSVLHDEHIPSLKLKGTAHQMSTIMTKFQKDKFEKHDERILLLELHNESASGANLTTANHVIFVHPLHVKTLQNYIMCETQAIGRVRRYGQKKNVRLYRFLVQHSVDTKIYEHRCSEQSIQYR